MLSRLLLIFIFTIAFSGSLKAQEDDYFLDSLLNSLETDSLTLFDLLDSIIRMDTDASDLTFKLSYISQILTSGRDFGVDQYGLSPGISYFHKSGIYADISGFWNSEYEPNYNMTIASLGYMFMVKDFWTNSLSYEHYFFNGESSDISNSLDFSSYFNIKFIDIGFDYSYMFGSETAHRISGNISGYTAFKNCWFFDKITVMPSFSVLFGDKDLLYRKFAFRDLTPEREFNFDWNQLTNNQKRIIIRRLLERYYSGDDQSGLIRYDEENVFGLMNYSFSLPIRFSIKNTSLVCTYNYNIPVELPGELYDWPAYDFFSLSLYQSISF